LRKASNFNGLLAAKETLLPYRYIKTSSRIGLSFKRWGTAALPFVCRNYRFFTVVPQKDRIRYLMTLFENQHREAGELTWDMAQELAVGYIHSGHVKAVYLAFLSGMQLWKEHASLDKRYLSNPWSNSSIAVISGYCYARGYI
jgi:hypothetical protein